MRLLAALLLVAALAAPAAHASFPGANGLLAVTEDVCDYAIERTHVQAYTAHGKRAHELTPRCELFDEGYGDFARDTFAPDWSPDGSRLLYAQERGGPEPARFESVAADGTGAVAVSPDSPDNLSSYNAPSYAPDGRRFAYLDRGKLLVAPGDGGEPAVLRDATSFLSVRWSPAASRMAVVRSGAQAGLWILDARTGKLLRRVVKGSIGAFDWSPDGRRLVFATTSYHGEDGDVTGGNLYVVRADGAGSKRLFVRTRGVGATNPAWSPDGRSIAWIQLRFTSGDVAFGVFPTLWRRPAAGGAARRLAVLDSPSVEEGYHSVPDLAWQALPRR